MTAHRRSLLPLPPSIRLALLVALALTFVAPAAMAIAPAATQLGPLMAQMAGDAATTATKKRRRRRKKRKKKDKVRAKKVETEEEKKASRKTKLKDEVPAAAEPAGEQNLGGLRRSNSMEFDARLVTGERPQAGAVYLFERAPRQLPPLVKLRQSYLRDIVDPVLGQKYGVKEKKPAFSKKVTAPAEPAAKPADTKKGKKGRR